jgi:WhiB family redox-sensing transcriptional regulator
MQLTTFIDLNGHREHAGSDILAGALSRAEPWGVWGGELLVQGSVVALKRARRRPRKSPVAA